MRKQFYIGFLTTATLAMMLVGCGKSNKTQTALTLKKKSLTVECGATEKISAKSFVNGSQKVLNETKFSCKGLEKGDVGTYDGTVTYKKEKYKVKVIIQDTLAPTATIQNNIIVKKGQSIAAADILSNVIDASKTQVGFTESKQIKKKVTKKNANGYNSYEVIDPAKNDNKNNKKGTKIKVKKEDLKSTLKFNKEGIYQIKGIAMDVEGNAVSYDISVIVDTKAPSISFKKDFKIKVEFVNGKEEITNSDGIHRFKVTDALDGDLTKNTDISFNNKVKNPKVTYIVSDRAGNELKITKKIPIDKKALEKSKKAYETEKREAYNENLRTPSNEDFSYILELENGQRILKKLYGLNWDNNLAKRAATKAKALSKKFKVGSSTKEIIFSADEENGAIQVVYKKWNGASLSRKVFMDPDFRKTGIGFYKDSEDVIYYCQIFEK